MAKGRTRVVVIGAGLAGLTAARYLERAGAEVTIVEARDRIGGRVLTLRDGLADGQHGEFGAELIEAGQEDVFALAKTLKLTPVRILRKGWAFHRASSKRRSVGSAVDTFEHAAKLLAPEIEAFRNAGSRWDSAVARQLARESTAGWLRRTRADAQFAAGIKGLRNFFLAEPDDLSLLVLVEQFAESEAPGASAMYRLKEGNDALPASLARQIKATIHLRTAVTRVSQRGRTVKVAVNDGAQRELTADFVVCTAPATTVRRILFEPALAEEQAAAIRTLRYGPATKVLLQFESRFWRGLARRSAYATDGVTGAVWDGNEDQSRAPGILTLLAGGDASREIQETIATRGPKALVRKLAWLGTPSSLVAAGWASWDRDPWSRGGYAVFGPSFDPSLRAWLARPAGRVVFAGEHTSVKWQGFMNGAVESGRRAALEVAMLAGLSFRDLLKRP